MDITLTYGDLFWIGIVICLIGFAISTIKIAKPWQRAIVLTLGKFDSVRGPGIFYVIPLYQQVAQVVDMRVITTSFNAEQTITKDTVPVTVDAVLFWQAEDAKKAALEVGDYKDSMLLAAQTALRDVIGKTDLSQILVGRRELAHELESHITERISSWGIKAISVEIRDVSIPTALQNAMSMQAQAERERQARIILGDSEKQVASKFNEAAMIYEGNPVALHLRGMNMLYESIKDGKGTIIMVPSSALDSMNLGNIGGITSLGKIAMPPAILPTAKETPKS